jgi:hypothetical protein
MIEGMDKGRDGGRIEKRTEGGIEERMEEG